MSQNQSKAKALQVITDTLIRERVSTAYAGVLMSLLEYETMKTDYKNKDVYFAVKLNRFETLANRDVIKKIIKTEVKKKEGGLSLFDFLNMSESKLRPELFTEDLERIERRYNIKVHQETVDFNCGKCGHKRAFISFVQLRSIDESKDTLYKCENCGSTKRVSGS